MAKQMVNMVTESELVHMVNDETKRYRDLMTDEQAYQYQLLVLNVVVGTYRSNGYKTHGMTDQELNMFLSYPGNLYESILMEDSGDGRNK